SPVASCSPARQQSREQTLHVCKVPIRTRFERLAPKYQVRAVTNTLVFRRRCGPIRVTRLSRAFWVRPRRRDAASLGRRSLYSRIGLGQTSNPERCEQTVEHHAVARLNLEGDVQDAANSSEE